MSDAQPVVMVTDPPYGVELDSEWRDPRRPPRAGSLDRKETQK